MYPLVDLSLRVAHSVNITTSPISNKSTPISDLSPPDTNEPLLIPIVAGSLSLSSASLVASVLVVYYVIRYKLYDKVFQRFPFYIAVNDFWFSIANLLNAVYMAGYLGDRDTVCEALGALNGFFAGTNLLLTLGLALYVYAFIVKHRELNYGRYEWKLLLLCLIVPALSLIVGIPMKVYGRGRFWCQNQLNSDTGNWTLYIMVATFTSLLIVILFCYISIIIEIGKVKRTLRQSQYYGLTTVVPSPIDDRRLSLPARLPAAASNTSTHPNQRRVSSPAAARRTSTGPTRSASLNTLTAYGLYFFYLLFPKKPTPRLAIRKLLFYILIFLIQWTPSLLFALQLLIHRRVEDISAWFLLASVFAGVSGGWMRFLVFYTTERYRWTQSEPPQSEETFQKKEAEEAAAAGVLVDAWVKPSTPVAEASSEWASTLTVVVEAPEEDREVENTSEKDEPKLLKEVNFRKVEIRGDQEESREDEEAKV